MAGLATGAVSAELTVIAPVKTNWNLRSNGAWSELADGLQCNGSGSRLGNTISSKDCYDLTGAGIYVKWKPHGHGTYMAVTPRIEPLGVEAGFFTTHHSYSGSTVVAENTWYFSRFQFTGDSLCTVVTCTGNYDDAGGTLFKTTVTNTAIRAALVKANNFTLGIHDNYGGTNAYVVLGELKTTAQKVPLFQSQQYGFEDDQLSPNMTVKGTSSVINGGYDSLKALQILVSTVDGFTLNLNNVGGVSFDVKHNCNDGIEFYLDGQGSSSLTGAGGDVWRHVDMALPATGNHELKLQVYSGAANGTYINNGKTIHLDNLAFWTTTATQPPVITTTSPLPSARVGIPYAQTLTASGGTEPYSWSIAVGSLPDGLALAGDGTISGTPTTAGTASFTVRVSGSDGAASTLPCTIDTLSGPEIANLTAVQQPGTRLVEIHYDLWTNAATVRLALQISADGGMTWVVPVSSATGDLGDAVVPGAGKAIIWDAGVDWSEQQSGAMRFRIVADSVDSPVVAPDGFALIPAGAFTMGRTGGDTDGDAPPVTVNVGAFFMAKHEVTKLLWDEVRAWGMTNGYPDLAVGAGKAANHPVQSVTWHDMVRWCNARSEMDRLTPCYTVGGAIYRSGVVDPVCDWTAGGYRLPSEAEWEKAARGGVEGRRFPWGADTISHSQANYFSTSGFDYDVSPTRGFHPTYNDSAWPLTAPVGSFAPNGYGLFDMAGNVFEWCWDWYGDATYTSGASDPRGPSSGDWRVARGGGWYGAEPVEYCFWRACHRDALGPVDSNTGLGFRVARSVVENDGALVAETPNREINSRSLTLTLTSDPAQGEVTGAGIYFKGAIVTVYATPLPGHLFTGWSGDATGSVDWLEVVMDADKTITAEFEVFAITTPSPLPDATIRKPYSQTFEVTGGTAPYSWGLGEGPVPMDMSMDGTLSGIPLGPYPWTSTFTVQVSDSNGNTTYKEFSLAVNAPPPKITSASPLAAGVVGLYYNGVLSASSSLSPFLTWTWSITGGSLPAGLNLSEDGTISGKPETVGTSSFTATAVDADYGTTAQREFQLEICPDSSLTALEVWPGTLSPPFSAAITNYHVTVATRTIQIQYGAVEGSAFRYRVDGGDYTSFNWSPQPLELNMGENTIDIEVTSPDGITTRAYTVTATRVPGMICDTSFNPAITSFDFDYIPVDSLAVQTDGKVLVGGSFKELLTETDLIPCHGFARLLPDGSPDSTFTPECNGRLSSIVVQADGKILVGGYFTLLCGQPCPGLGRLNPNGTLDASFSPATNGSVWAMLVQGDGKILVSGAFATLGGQANVRIGRLHADGSLDTTFALTAEPEGAYYPKLALQTDGKILAGGYGLKRLHSNGTPDTTFAETDITINTGVSYPGAGWIDSLVVQADGKIVVGGYFSHLNGSPRRSIGRLNPNGSLDLTFDPNVSGEFEGGIGIVRSLLVQPDGKIVVGGEFQSLGDLPRRNLGRLNPDGSIDQNFDPGASYSYGQRSQVRCIALQPDGKILVGGHFVYLGGEYMFALGRLMMDTTSSPILITTPSALPTAALGVPYTKSLVATGDAAPFTWSVPAGRLPEGLVLSGAGVITGTPVVQETTHFTVRAVDSDGMSTTRYFTLPVGNPADADLCALWHSASDTLTPAFSPAVTQYTANVMQGSIYVTAYPQTLDATVQSRINGGEYLSWESWQEYVEIPLNPGTNTIEVKVTSGDGLFSKTYTLSVNRTVSNRLSALSLTPANLSPAFAPDTLAYTATLPVNRAGFIAEPVDPSAILEWRRGNSGAFTPITWTWDRVWLDLLTGANPFEIRVTAGDASTRTYKLTLTRVPGTNVDGFNPGASRERWTGSVSAMAIQPDGKVVVGGYFDILGGEACARLGRLNPDGTRDSDFQASANRPVEAIVRQADGKILVSGGFTELSGVTRPYLGRLNPDGSLDASFAPVLSSRPSCLAVQADGRILVGGSFTSVGGHARTYLARLLTDGTLDDSFSPAIADAEGYATVYALEVQSDGRIVVGGLFETVNGQPRASLVRLNTDGSLDGSFVPPRADGYEWLTISCLAIRSDGKIMAGAYDYSGYRGLQVLNTDGSVDTSIVIENDHRVNTLLTQSDGKILVGGNFSSLLEQPRPGLARLNADGTLDSSFNPGCDGSVSCFVEQPDGRIVVGGSFSTLGGQLRENIGRLVADDQGSPVAIRTFPAPPAGTVGQAYAHGFTAEGGIAPYAWSLSSGTLPAGLSIDPATGEISGTPTAAGSSVFTVQAADLEGQLADSTVTLMIANSAVGGYSGWKASKFSATELADPLISGDNADPDHDGVPNVVECALALEPKTADVAGNLPHTGEAGGLLTFTYRQSKAATDLAFVPQTTTNLTSDPWSAAGFTETGREDMGAYWLVTVRHQTPIRDCASRFVRLKVVPVQ